MPRKKGFDCVEMKRRLQEELAREHPAPSKKEQHAAIVRDLALGDDPVSRKWRQLIERRRADSARP